MGDQGNNNNNNINPYPQQPHSPHDHLGQWERPSHQQGRSEHPQGMDGDVIYYRARDPLPWPEGENKKRPRPRDTDDGDTSQRVATPGGS